MLLSRAVEKYHAKTYGQIPPVLTRYESSAMWKGHRFDNQKIKNLGWKQTVPTEEAMRETFAYLRGANESARPKRIVRIGELSGTRSFS